MGYLDFRVKAFRGKEEEEGSQDGIQEGEGRYESIPCFLLPPYTKEFGTKNNHTQANAEKFILCSSRAPLDKRSR
jgi:hypothetical protein